MKKTIRRALVLLSALAVLFCLAAFAAADDVIAEGDLNNSAIHWRLGTDNVLTISGEGEMPWFYYEGAPWYGHRFRIKTVIIEEGVTTIEDYAFKDCTALTEVSIPESVTAIGNSAFRYCSALTEITIPESVTAIGDHAFCDCTALTEVSIPESVTSIGIYAFGRCTTLTEISIPESVSTIENYAFYHCIALTEINIPEGVTAIGDGAFQGCAALTEINIPEGVTTIGSSTFGYCTALTEVSIPESVITIGSSAFGYCTALAFVEFAGEAPGVGTTCFPDTTALYYHKDAAGWTSPTWNGYHTAQIEPFDDYSTLDAENRNAQGILFTLNETAKTATVGDGSTTKNNAGYYGAQKGAVIIPDTVTKNSVTYTVIGINQNAFSENKQLTSVSMGAGVSSVIPTAFRDCPNFEGFTVSDSNTYYMAQDGVLYDAEGLYLYVYPGGKQDAEFIVPETVKTIGGKAFTNNLHLTSLTVGQSVTAIYAYAFCDLDNLTEITLPFIGQEENDTRHYIYGTFQRVFGDNEPKSLQSATILGSNLPERAFFSCDNLTEITLASTPETIPEQCFYGCTNLQKLTFADSHRTCEIGQLVLPEGIKTVEGDAFYCCSSITAVELPASLTDLDSSAFSRSGVETFSVAAGNENYSTDSWGVLYNKDKTTLVQYPPCRPWPYYNVADSATAIRWDAFSGCNELINLYIPNTVTSISISAITGCPNLTLCCYMGSAAYDYARNYSLTAWYMDNKTLQNIRIYSLPEQTVQQEGAVDLQGLYIVGDYQGKELQIDDYTLSYDQSSSGVKTVTVEYQGKTVTFEMIFFTEGSENIIRFTCEEDLDGKTVMIAVYSEDGEMLCTDTAVITEGTAQIGVSDRVFENADHAKLFILDEDYAPAAEAKTQPVE